VVPRDLDRDSVTRSDVRLFPYQGRRGPLLSFDLDILLDRG